MIKSILVLLAAAGLACSAAQDKQQLQGAAIGAGCKEALDIARAQGDAGDLGEIALGCQAELRVWRKAPVGGSGGAQ